MTRGLRRLTWIIHECRREVAETEARRDFSQVRMTQAYLRSVEENRTRKATPGERTGYRSRYS
jgi:hypothetical protein